MSDPGAGDIVEIDAGQGALAYLHVMHGHPSYPPVVRAIPGRYDARPALDSLLAQEGGQVAMVSLALATLPPLMAFIATLKAPSTRSSRSMMSVHAIVPPRTISKLGMSMNEPSDPPMTIEPRMRPKPSTMPTIVAMST